MYFFLIKYHILERLIHSYISKIRVIFENLYENIMQLTDYLETWLNSKPKGSVKLRVVNTKASKRPIKQKVNILLHTKHINLENIWIEWTLLFSGFFFRFLLLLTQANASVILSTPKTNFCPRADLLNVDLLLEMLIVLNSLFWFQT